MPAAATARCTADASCCHFTATSLFGSRGSEVLGSQSTQPSVHEPHGRLQASRMPAPIGRAFPNSTNTPTEDEPDEPLLLCSTLVASTSVSLLLIDLDRMAQASGPSTRSFSPSPIKPSFYNVESTSQRTPIVGVACPKSPKTAEYGLVTYTLP